MPKGDSQCAKSLPFQEKFPENRTICWTWAEHVEMPRRCLNVWNFDIECLPASPYFLSRMGRTCWIGLIHMRKPLEESGSTQFLAYQSRVMLVACQNAKIASVWYLWSKPMRGISLCRKLLQDFLGTERFWGLLIDFSWRWKQRVLAGDVRDSLEWNAPPKKCGERRTIYITGLSTMSRLKTALKNVVDQLKRIVLQIQHRFLDIPIF